MQSTPTEAELIRLAQQGDEDALTALYEANVEVIFVYLNYRVRSRSAAEDLTSEVFLRMVRGLPNYRNQGIPFRAWLFKIAANLLTDHYRQHGKYNTLPVSENEVSPDLDLLEHISEEDEKSALRQAILMLPEAYQTLLLLRFVENLPHSEVAYIMQKSVVALRAMQHRALKALGEQLEKRKPHKPTTREDLV